MACLGIVLISTALFGTDFSDQKGLIKQAALLFLLYLSGSIPFGLFIAKAFTKKDVRNLGSGNIGTSNVLRTGSKTAAFLTLTFDLLKGLIPILLLQRYAPSTLFTTPLYDSLLLVPVLGHMYPCWLHFKGGKGIATGLGVLLAFSWPLALVGLLIWLISAAVFRISSLAGLISFGLLPVLALSFAPWQQTIRLFVLSALVFWAHRDNIKRLLTGQEKKIGKAPK
ncbi:MAG: glycerol-3-phosphate 1-O-acyltransferase PlsY [Alphaproteobacteria bacterium]|nr:glycerol-3-phosphate 1-O-acyltransferase PlsY [Alphaproteobacteria bacterium]NCQ67225.1 glycerol-3-phosphate 1-O-acyltransferase PlsY [Alphaproteobacteria bacterium]NCT07069.1 glycerol-3-phosphate 1-O-acyltransferase PlsY [Alphaproteobacteria bacterium]